MRKISLAVIFTFYSFFLIAQPTPPGDPPPGPGEPVPLSGIEILLVAGSVLGAGKFLVKKLRER